MYVCDIQMIYHIVKVVKYWIDSFLCLSVKPKEFDEEEQDSADPNSFYFVYICTKKKDMVTKKKVKLGKLNKKQLKDMQPSKRKAPNLKHGDVAK